MELKVRKRFAAALLAVAVVATGGTAYAAAGDGPTDEQAQSAVDLLDAYVKNRPTVTETVTETATPVPSSPTVTVTETATETVTAPATTVTVTPSPLPAATVTETVTAPATTVTTTVTETVTASPSPSTTSPEPSTTSPSPTAIAKRWYSGAGLDLSNNVPVAFGTWRGEATGALGGWDDNKDAQTNIYTLDIGVMKNWNGVMDIAVGAIYSGESWANAATGAYDARWTTSLTNIKNKLGARDPNLVNIRFAHEMNGNWTTWKVPTGQEASFKAALIRFSNLRYQVFGAAATAPQVVLCANDGTSGGMADPRNLFVSKDSQNRQVVDVYCADTYNSWPHRTDYAAIRASQDLTGANGIPIGINAHRKFAQSVGVPFSVGEWGNCGTPNSGCDGGGGESPAYMKAMNDFFRENAGDPANPVPGQLLYELYFDLWSQYTLYSSGSNMNQPQSAVAYRDLVWGQ